MVRDDNVLMCQPNGPGLRGGPTSYRRELMIVQGYRAARLVASVGLVALIGIACGAGGTSDAGSSQDAPAPHPVEPTKAQVSFPATLTGGTRFSVVYEPQNASDSRTLSPSISIELWEGSVRRNKLITGDPPSVLDADGPIPGSQLHGGGPYEFLMPADLAPGQYTLCSGVGFLGDEKLEPWCRAVQVRPPS